jgi:predicted small metal-binding protein
VFCLFHGGAGADNRKQKKESVMSRKYIDCREVPQVSSKCTVAISADTTDEVVETAVEHSVKVHGYEDTPDLREHIRAAVKEGTPRS